MFISKQEVKYHSMIYAIFIQLSVFNGYFRNFRSHMPTETLSVISNEPV
jgi:hypothetical protein